LTKLDQDGNPLKERPNRISGQYDLNQEVEEEQSYNDKKVKLVSDMVNNKIHVSYNISYENNCAMKTRGSGYRIELNGSIPVRAGLDHELSHVREGSLDSQFWKPFKGMIDNWYAKNVPTDAKGRLADNVTQTVCRDAMNIIEDIRIESIDGEIFVGRKRAYKNMCRDAGLEWDAIDYEPKMGEIHAYVLAKRFFRDDKIPKVHKKEVDSIFEQSECTTVRGIHKVFHDWLDGSLGNYILERIKILNEKKEKQEKNNRQDSEDRKNDFDKISNAIDKLIGDTPNGSKSELEGEKKEEHTKLTSQLMDADHEVNKAERKIYQDRRDVDNEALDRMNKNIIEETHTGGYQPTDKQLQAIEDKMNKTDPSREKGKKGKDIQDMKSLHNAQPAPPISMNVEPLETNGGNNYYQDLEKADIYNDAVAEIRRTFTTLKQKSKPKLSDEGDDIDIESFLEQIKKGGNEFYISNKKVEGTSILIAVDCSGSMREGDKLQICKNITATMFRSVQNIPTIDMKAVCYGGGSESNRKTGILEINSEKQCNKIGFDRNHMLTPTSISLVYCAEALNRMKGKKKLMIYLTDGVPQCAERTNHMSLAVQAGKTYRNIKTANPNMIIKPLMITTYDHYDSTLKKIFGNEYLKVPIDDVPNFIRKEFKRAVKDSMK
jgi:hypothetical protein